MKHMKRLCALLLAVVMVMGMATTVFAAEGDEAQTYAYQYEIYQIFTGEFEDDVLTDVKWGKNGTGTEGADVDTTVLEALEAVEDTASNEAKLKVILNYFNSGSTAYQTLDTNANPTTVNNLLDGYYLVKDVAGTQEDENESYTVYIVKVVDGTLTIDRKADVPKVEKKIVEGTNKVDENAVSIGDTVNYEITGTLPSNIADYDTYYYVFTDTLSKGLTLTDTDATKDGIQNNIKVEIVNGTTVTDVTKYFYINATEYSETTGTTITVGIQDLLLLDNDNDTDTDGIQPVVSVINADTKIVVTYSAVLNKYAEVGTTGNKNDVDLEYSNDPNTDGDGSTTPPPTPQQPNPQYPTGKTPKDEVFTYTTDLTIIKKDQDGNILTGAEFTLTGEQVNVVVVSAERFVEDANGTYWKLNDGTYTTTAPVEADDPSTPDTDEKTSDAYADVNTKYALKTVTEVQEKTETVSVKAYVGEDGTVKFTGLGAGTYTITESVVPAGYNSVNPITVTIGWSADGTNCTWTYGGTDFEDTDNDGVHDEGEPYLATVTVINQRGTTLPETGGMGTTLFYVLGGVLMLAAVVLLVTKKRMGAAE